jgi:hypothetical protein
MTANFLIGEIFARPQDSIASNMRWLSIAQFNALRGMLLKEGSSQTLHHGEGGSLVWAPAAGDKYILTEDRVRLKHTLTRLAKVGECKSGSLFG